MLVIRRQEKALASISAPRSRRIYAHCLSSQDDQDSVDQPLRFQRVDGVLRNEAECDVIGLSPRYLRLDQAGSTHTAPSHEMAMIASTHLYDFHAPFQCRYMQCRSIVLIPHLNVCASIEQDLRRGLFSARQRKLQRRTFTIFTRPSNAAICSAVRLSSSLTSMSAPRSSRICVEDSSLRDNGSCSDAPLRFSTRPCNAAYMKSSPAIVVIRHLNVCTSIEQFLCSEVSDTGILADGPIPLQVSLFLFEPPNEAQVVC